MRHYTASQIDEVYRGDKKKSWDVMIVNTPEGIVYDYEPSLKGALIPKSGEMIARYDGVNNQFLTDIERIILHSQGDVDEMFSDIQIKLFKTVPPQKTAGVLNQRDIGYK